MPRSELAAAVATALNDAGVFVDPPSLGAFCAELERRGAAVEELNLADLFLAFRARQKDPQSLAEVDRRIRIAAAKVKLRGALDLDELAQRVRERVLVGSAQAPPRLAAYAGKGALLKWLQAVAATTAIDATRAVGPEEAEREEAAFQAAASSVSADVALGDAQSKRAFTRAFKAAVEKLPARERTVMRMRYVDQANLDEIAVLYKVHRTTVMRWLESSHAQVLEETRLAMARELGLRGKALDSLIRGVELSFAERVSQLLQKP
jgi:RNA polymerase sigma-70 factor, ECF subfamily